MHLYMDEIKTSTKIFNLKSNNSIKKQNWNCYKAAAVLMNNHEAKSSSTAMRTWSTQVSSQVKSILYFEVALSRWQLYVCIHIAEEEVPKNSG
jgi:hypothetical protein